MAGILVRILIGASLVMALETGVAIAGGSEGHGLFETLRLYLTVTGILLLLGGGLGLLGPGVDGTQEIRPMQGNFAVRERRLGSFGTGAGGNAVLLSSGTRSLWDAGANPALRGKPPTGFTALGVGGILTLVGLAFGLL